LTDAQVALFGAWAGIAGGIIGTYVSVRKARGPLERRFILKAVPWVFAYVVIVGIMLDRYVPWFVYAPIYWTGLILIVSFLNRRQKAIRQVEESQRQQFLGDPDDVLRRPMWRHENFWLGLVCLFCRARW